MKKVKIPTSMNPFVVHVNGEKYVYPAGTEQEVTDAVANVIDAYIKKENQQPDPTESPFSTSWNDLKDKPFGTETTVKGDTLTWDGNTEGLVSCTNAPFYKVSDAIPTRANCVNGITIFLGGEKTFDGETAQGAFMEDGAAAFDCVFIIPCDNYDVDGMVFPKAGVYFLNDGDGFMVSSLTIPNYNGFETTTIKPIDTKYLPEHLQFGTEKAFEQIVWDGNTEGLEVSEGVSGKLVHISSLKITDPTNIENLVMFNIENGETATDPDFLVNQPVDGIFELQNGLVLLVNNTFQGMSEGVWANMIDDVPVRIAEINPKSIVKPLAEQYMPILTSPSGKKFKLSVDDSGVLSATEV